MADADERERRRAARSSWPGHVTNLGEQSDDLSAGTTLEERLAMMWELAVRAWSLTGAPFPEYERSKTPGRVIRAAGDV